MSEINTTSINDLPTASSIGGNISLDINETNKNNLLKARLRSIKVQLVK